MHLNTPGLCQSPSGERHLRHIWEINHRWLTRHFVQTSAQEDLGTRDCGPQFVARWRLDRHVRSGWEGSACHGREGEGSYLSSEGGSCDKFSPALAAGDLGLAGEPEGDGGLRLRELSANASWRGLGTRRPAVWDLVVALLIRSFMM